MTVVKTPITAGYTKTTTYYCPNCNIEVVVHVDPTSQGPTTVECQECHRRCDRGVVA